MRVREGSNAVFYARCVVILSVPFFSFLFFFPNRAERLGWGGG